MPAITFNLNRVLSSAGSGIIFTLGLTAADYTAAIVAEQRQEAIGVARHYTYLSLPATAVAWSRGATVDALTSAKWQRTAELDKTYLAAYGRTFSLDYTRSAYWSRAAPTDAASLSLLWSRALAVDGLAFSLPWGNNKPVDAKAIALQRSKSVEIDVATKSIRWLNPGKLESSTALVWGRAVPYDIQASLPYYEGPALDSVQTELPWGVARPVIDYLIPPVVNPNEPELPPLDLQKGRGFACFHLGKTRQSNFNVYALNRRINNDSCFAGSFTVNNTFSAITIADGLPLEITSFSANTDKGSNAWDFTLGLPRLAELNRVKPTASGPIEVECVLNGYTFRMVVESYDESRAHGSWGYSATARGLTVYASSPFAATTSAVLPAAQRTASQLANDAVAALGGFSVNWEAYNFLVQPNMLSYDGLDPLGVVSRLANAIGAVVIPHRFNKEFTVRSQYAVSPWDWALPGTSIAQVIPKTLMLKSSGRFSPNPTINKVYVAATASGYNAGVKRTGTAGNLLGAQITEALLSQPAVSPTAAGNLERGRVELARSGPRREYTIITPLVAANVTPGVRLREPTELVEVEDDEAYYRGEVGKVGLTMTTEANGLRKVYQTLGVERYV